MNAAKTTFAAAAFGVVAVVAPVEAGEVKRNFTSELHEREVAAASRSGGEREGLDPNARALGRDSDRIGELKWPEFHEFFTDPVSAWDRLAILSGWYHRPNR